MDRLGEMHVFVRAVEDGGFSAAARALSLTPSTVSKLITRLECRLGVSLFHRSSRSVVLTPEGEVFYSGARYAIEAVEDAEAATFAEAKAQGTLRIRSIPTFVVYQLAPLIPAFRRLHPSLRLEFLLDSAETGLLEGGTDVAIHTGDLADSSLIARRIASSRWIICAAPEYLQERGTPRVPSDLGMHECLNFRTIAPWSVWTVRNADRSRSRVKVGGSVVANQGDMLLALARAGVGIVRLAEFHVGADLRSGRLVELFPEQQDQTEEPIYIVYRGRRHLSRRIQVFLEFLEAAFPRRVPPWRNRAGD